MRSYEAEDYIVKMLMTNHISRSCDNFQLASWSFGCSGKLVALKDHLSTHGCLAGLKILCL